MKSLITFVHFFNECVFKSLKVFILNDFGNFSVSLIKRQRRRQIIILRDNVIYLSLNFFLFLFPFPFYQFLFISVLPFFLFSFLTYYFLFFFLYLNFFLPFVLSYFPSFFLSSLHNQEIYNFINVI